MIGDSFQLNYINVGMRGKGCGSCAFVCLTLLPMKLMCAMSVLDMQRDARQRCCLWRHPICACEWCTLPRRMPQYDALHIKE